MENKRIINEIFSLIYSFENYKNSEINSLKNELQITANAHKDLISNYAIVNREFIDLLNVTYPCMRCGKEIEVNDIERFNPDMNQCENCDECNNYDK